jgi:tRNA A-37 threonylcarbamoyl transferase component Bud32
MESSTPSSACPDCGSPLEASGLCARCLMAGAAEPTEPSATSGGPDLEQVAAAFPQLEILGLIGRGGMGSVFKVRQPKLNRFAALKLLPDSLAADPAFAGRFEREAQVLARLSHPNIVAVYDYGQAYGFFYLLMEFVDGVNLRQAMRAARFTPEQALGIVPKICEALQFAHDEGVLHRDIKPENLLLDSRGRVKLADFGIAKLAAEGDLAGLGEGAQDPLFTQSGTALGTPSYMAPEQRESPSEVDHRADIYSLGVVFYELLTGELPRQVFAAPSAKSAADPRVDDIVRQALEKDRNFRQRSAGEMKTQVETLGELSPELKAGMDVFGGFSAFAAVVLSIAGTSEKGRTEAPKSSNGVPVTVTSIGIGEPWLIEHRWMAAEAPGEPLKQAGGVHAAPSPWVFSGVAVVMAGLCWTMWFLKKYRCGERLDSKLDEDGGRPSFAAICYLWIGALAFLQWLIFSILGLLMLFREEWDLPVRLMFVFKASFFLAAIWVIQGSIRRRWGSGGMPGPGPWPFRLVGTLCGITLVAFTIKAGL